MKKQFLSTFLSSSVVLAAAAGLIKYPREISAAVRASLTLCTDTLLPGLFPFFVLSSLIMKLELLRPLENALTPVMGKIFHLPGNCACPLVLGVIGGYPTGARSAVELYRSGQCSRDEAIGLLTFCNNCGPAFLFGVVGCGILGHPRYGLLLTTVHVVAAVLTGRITNHCRPIPTTHRTRTLSKPTPLAAAFVDSVTGALRTLLDLFSFVLCFGAITELLSISGGATGRAVSVLLPFLAPETGTNLLLGLLEMTHGVSALSAEPLPLRLILSAALTGWGGVSVHCQVLSLLRDTDLSASSYLKGKALHAALSALLMWGLLRHIEATCLAAGGILLFLPCRTRKKAVENERKVLYNQNKQIKGAMYHEPVPEVN